MILTAAISLCMAVADGAVEAADAAQRGQPLIELLSTLDAGLEEDAALIMREFTISAYEAGKNHNLREIHNAYYRACVAEQGRA